MHLISDTAVAAEGRHSLKVLLPSATPLVLPFPGKQLVPPPPPPLFRFGAAVPAPVGSPVVGGSITLLPGHTYHVTLAVQATPAGTRVELLGGLWQLGLVPKHNTITQNAFYYYF